MSLAVDPPPLGAEEGAPLSSLSASNALRGLVLNLRQVAALRHLVPPGDVRFEALCHGVASAMQEVSLRLVKLCEGDAHREMREDLLECRKALLDGASALVYHARQPRQAFAHLESLPAACAKALGISERQTSMAIERAAAGAVQSLDLLEKSSGYPDLFRNIKHFGSRLHGFLELSALHCHDLRSESAKEKVVSNAETVRKLLPVVIQSLREALQRPLNSHSRTNRAFFFRIVRGAIDNVVDAFRVRPGDDGDASEDASVGQFVRTLDAVLESCEAEAAAQLDGDRLERTVDAVEWLVKFCLAVGEASREADGARIVEACKDVVREVGNLRAEVGHAASCGSLDRRGAGGGSTGSLCFYREVNVARDLLRDAVEDLEQALNNSLLRLIIELFCQAHSPLDQLIHGVLNSEVGPPERRPEDLDTAVAAFDDWTDLLFHVCHFATLCTNDKPRSRDINRALAFMQLLEAELVPACLKLYFNPNDQGARAHLRSIRTLWLQELEGLERSILGIVDSTAFCYVIHEEAKSLGGTIKRQQYNQDHAWLHRFGAKLVRMCQRAVDFAWREVARDKDGGDRGEALPDDHPIVKVERSTWEVQGALRMVLANIEDLNLHKTMIRRVQVLVTCLGIMAKFLVSRNESDLSTSKVRVLTSVTRITIGHDSKMTVEGQGRGNNASISRSKAMSFRSVQRKESILQKRRRDEQEEDESVPDRQKLEVSVAKLAKEARKSHFPYQTRKMAASFTSGQCDVAPNKRPGSAKAKVGFDFTEIFDELSALSREITEALETRDDGELGVDGVEPLPVEASAVGQTSAVASAKEISLRKMAFRNAASTSPMTHMGMLHLTGGKEASAQASSNRRAKRSSCPGVGGGSEGVGGGSSRESPASNDDGADSLPTPQPAGKPPSASAAAASTSTNGYAGLTLVHSPERLRDIKSLDAKLAAIKSELEGSEA